MEGGEQQDDAGLRRQPLPESVPEEQEIDADGNGYHRQNAKRDGRGSGRPIPVQ
jgi:hypothetical protein